MEGGALGCAWHLLCYWGVSAWLQGPLPPSLVTPHSAWHLGGA